MHKDTYLTIKNQFVFNRVMSKKEICIGFLECVLGIDVGDITYRNTEQAFEPSLGSKGVRLDVFVKNDTQMYDIEMQCVPNAFLSHRFRYYQAAMDVSTLEKGQDFDELLNSIVIFICDFDPYGKGEAIYRFSPKDESGLDADCGITWVALNCKAYKKATDADLYSLLEYISDGIMNKDDLLVQSIDCEVKIANQDRKWVEKMITPEMVIEDREREIRMQRRLYERKLKETAEASRREGEARGIAEGEARGIVQGEKRLGSLIEKLLSSGRESDALKASTDTAFRKQLFQEFGI